MIEILAIRVFAARNAAHVQHWKTESYAKHVALGEFYDAVIDSLDAVVEAHQSLYGRVDIGEFPKQPKTTDIIEHLEDDLDWIDKNRQKITQGRQAIDNLLQTLEADYMAALYKLKNLS